MNSLYSCSRRFQELSAATRRFLTCSLKTAEVAEVAPPIAAPASPENAEMSAGSMNSSGLLETVSAGRPPVIHGTEQSEWLAHSARFRTVLPQAPSVQDMFLR